MKKTKHNESINPHKIHKFPQICNSLFYMCLSFFYLDMILKLEMDEKFIWTGVLYSFLFSVFYGMLVFLVMSFFQRFLRIFLGGAILFIITVIYCSQFIYYEFFKTFYSIFSAAKGGQVIEFFVDVLFVIAANIFWLFTMFIPFIFYIVLSGKFKAEHKYHWHFLSLTGILAAVVFGISLFFINIGPKDRNSPYDLYYKNSYPVYSVMNLGLLTTMRLDLQRSVLGFEPVLNINKNSGSGSSLPAVSEAEPSKAPEYNIMDIDFNALMKQTDDKTLNDMHAFFKNAAPTAQNDYTGLFKGYNLIFVTAEGYSQYAVDKTLTPTLYKMTHEGFNFTEFYNPLWGVSTSDGEYVATTSLFPKIGVWSMYLSGKNRMPFAMGNQLRTLGYTTFAYHNHSYKYYGRNVSHPNLGYIYKAVGHGLDVASTWPESDLEMMEKSVDDYISSDYFHAYYMTVSGHLRYSFAGNFIAKKNRSLVSDLPYSDAVKAYMATQIELDRAMGYLLERLDAAGVAGKTLIVINADHYPYGLKKSEIDELAGHQVESNFELYRNSLIIYVKGMTPKTIDRPVSSIDIIPTVSNLLGLEFDSRLLMGTDVFSDKTPLVVFLNGSFITERGKYNAVSKEFTLNPGMAADDDYRKKISEDIEKKFYFSTKILDLDYYSKILKG